MNREQPAFLIFPVCLDLTVYKYLSKLRQKHTIYWTVSNAYAAMIHYSARNAPPTNLIHGSTQSHVPRGETWPCQPTKITPFQWRSWLLRLYSVAIRLQVSFKTWSFYQKLNNLQTRSKQLFVFCIITKTQEQFDIHKLKFHRKITNWWVFFLSFGWINRWKAKPENFWLVFVIT